MIAEGAGALATAAALAGRAGGGRVVAIVSGGNIDFDTLARDPRRRDAAQIDRGLLAAPLLEGSGASDYERYLRTDELLALQKTPEEWVHRDELLFQTVHQSSELWLKLASSEVEEAARPVRGRLDLGGACGCCAAPSLRSAT